MGYFASDSVLGDEDGLCVSSYFLQRGIVCNGNVVSGKVLAYSLYALQDRGCLYIGPTIEVYEGMGIGNASKGEDMTLNSSDFGEPTRNRTWNESLEGSCYIHLTMGSCYVHFQPKADQPLAETMGSYR